MPVELADSLLRPQLHQRILVTWNPTRIYDSGPRVPVNTNALPLAFLQLQTIQPEYTGRQAAFGTVSLWHRYLITGLFAFPTDPEVTLEDYKVERAQSLVSFLTASGRFLDYAFHLALVQFSETGTAADPERQEPILEITVGFDVEVDSPV